QSGASPSIHTLSLHDALPICGVAEIPDHDLGVSFAQADQVLQYLYHHVFVEHVQEKVGNDHVVMLKLIHFHDVAVNATDGEVRRDRKSTRLNSSHVKSSYAVF